jgi:hypothetical protein
VGLLPVRFMQKDGWVAKAARAASSLAGLLLPCRGTASASAPVSAAVLSLCCGLFQPALGLPAAVLGIPAPWACSLLRLWLAQCCHHIGGNLWRRWQQAAAPRRPRRSQRGWRGPLQLAPTACRVCVFVWAAHGRGARLLRWRHSSGSGSQLARRAPQGRPPRPALLAAAIRLCSSAALTHCFRLPIAHPAQGRRISGRVKGWLDVAAAAPPCRRPPPRSPRRRL